ncbi:MAG: hypothetical protein QOJ46_1381 [bacterium]
MIDWVATHRKHHRFSDHPGDPHSPHLEPARGWRRTLRGLGRAYIGWVFRGRGRANPARYAKNLHADLDLLLISRTTSARHGLGRWQLDPSAGLINGLERCHLAGDIIRTTPQRQQAKRAAPS